MKNSHTSTSRRARTRTLAATSGIALTAILTAGMTASSHAAQPSSPSARIAAGSGTITYIANHNVFVASQDGTSPRQVTKDGTAANPWYSPTQSDAGQIVAGHGTLIYRMDQFGQTLNTIDPPDLRSGGSETLGGAPTSLAVSPDGNTIAYSYVKNYCSFPNNVCKNWPVTGFTASTKVTSPETYGTTYGDTPSWVTNSRVVVDNRGPFDNIYLYDLGRGTVGTYWFGDENLHPTGYTSITDIEISRGAPYAIGIEGTGDQTRAVFLKIDNLGDYRTGIPTSPDPSNGLCATTIVPGISGATWSADGATAAWQEGGSVHMAAMGAAPCQSEPVAVIAGGSSPSFSPAVLQTTKPDAPGDQKFDVKSKTKVSGKAKVGKKLKAKAAKLSPSATKVKYQWFRDKKAIKGAIKVTYKVSKADRKHKLRVRTTSTRSGYKKYVNFSKAVRVIS